MPGESVRLIEARKIEKEMTVLDVKIESTKATLKEHREDYAKLVIELRNAVREDGQERLPLRGDDTES